MKKIAGSVVLKGDRVTLYRECGEHGPTDMLLSRNARLYADWDRFYFSVLKRGKPRGRIINYWVVCTSECQMQCSFCHADVQDRYAEEMSRADFDSVIRHDTRAKLTISGGEPTLHPDLIYCIREAVRAGRNIQLATNGICLADGEFCKKLGAEGLRNVRLSCELLDPKKAPTSEFGRWLDTKFHAIENLERYGYSVTLSPTIFKGVNEELLLESLACAAARPCITTVSVNGFSWVGHGTVRDRDEMIMPDEMMDLIARRFGIDDRESLFTLQKMLFTLLQLLNVRACAYTQLMLFVRRAGALEPIVRYFNMKRMKKGMRFWEKFSRAPYPIQLAAFCLAMTYGLAGRSCALFGDIVKVGARYLWRGNGSLRPSRFLTVILNTNCSTLTMDEEVGKQCMSGVLIKKGGKVFRSQSSDLLIDKEIEKHRRATGGPADSLEHCACLVELEK
ncbi:MAG: radical SAM protein [Candidatus Aureabacteria bacterium]|nr:radical SAM protein [Candidatus Auribacterota bacterium]